MPFQLPGFLRNMLEPNPVLVRELKQFVRNRLLLYFMLCYLLLLSVTAIVAMIDFSMLSGLEWFTFDMVRFSDTTGNGLTRFVLLSYYAFASAFLVLFGAIKMGYERLKNDLGYYTTLSAWGVIRGKFLLGVVVSFLFLSIALPFLTIAYMMRGVGLDTVVYSAIYFYLYTLIQYSFTLAFFSGAKTLKRVYVFALALLLVQGLAWFFGFVFGTYGYLDDDFIVNNFAWSGFCIEAMFIFMPLPLAVCQVSPESANRMLPIRMAMTIMAMLLVLFTFVQYLNDTRSWGFNGPENIFYGLGFFTYYFIPFVILIGICEREQYTIRQRLRIPKNLLGRLLLFPFGTGVFNAIVWFTGYLLFLAGFYLLLKYGLSLGKSSHVIDEFFDEILKVCMPFSILIFDYAVTAFLLWKIVLHRFVSREWLAFGILGLSVGLYLAIIVMELVNPRGPSAFEDMVSACFFYRSLSSLRYPSAIISWFTKRLSPLPGRFSCLPFRHRFA